MAKLSTAETYDILRGAWISLTLKISQSVQIASDQKSIFEAVRDFDFKENDQNCDHDFGIVKVNGCLYYFSFDLVNGDEVLSIGQVKEFS